MCVNKFIYKIINVHKNVTKHEKLMHFDSSCDMNDFGRTFRRSARCYYRWSLSAFAEIF